MKIKRIITGLIALPLLIAFILKGSIFQFSCFIVILSVIGLLEFYRMALPERRFEGALASIAGALFCIAIWSKDFMWLLLAITLFVLSFGLIFLLKIKDIKMSAGEVAMMFLGVLYVPLLLSHLALLRDMAHGVQWIFLLLIIVMSGDTAAFYIGRAFGKKKLYPIVSPNKSIEGSLGGLAGSIAGAFIAKATFFSALSPIDSIMTAVLLGCLGQLGDLFESMLKRSFGVKDSGSIVPGHGGILDRLDSILFAAPAAFFYACYVFLPG
jgi:phosphatidate cytidylyltransferase